MCTYLDVLYETAQVNNISINADKIVLSRNNKSINVENRKWYVRYHKT